MKNKLSFIAKVIITQIPAFVALLCLSSCDNSTMKRNISVADSLTEADQAAAVRYIDSITRAETGISRYDRMKLLLLKTKALNKLNRPLSIDTLTMLVKYFDRHGTANDRMLANYIMGWKHVYNNPLKAMRYFHIAAEAADTTDGN